MKINTPEYIHKKRVHSMCMSLFDSIRRLFSFSETDESPNFAGMSEYGEKQLRNASNEELLRMLREYSSQLEDQLNQLDIDSDIHRVQNAADSPSSDQCQVAFTTTELGGVEATCIELTAFIKEFKYRSCDGDIDFEKIREQSTNPGESEIESNDSSNNDSPSS